MLDTPVMSSTMSALLNHIVPLFLLVLLPAIYSLAHPWRSRALCPLFYARRPPTCLSFPRRGRYAQHMIKCNTFRICESRIAAGSAPPPPFSFSVRASSVLPGSAKQSLFPSRSFSRSWCTHSSAVAPAPRRNMPEDRRTRRWRLWRRISRNDAAESPLPPGQEWSRSAPQRRLIPCSGPRQTAQTPLASSSLHFSAPSPRRV
ncbi:uncharacterized protein BJ171DRAFT_254666 [Polychytrium aggregatum]|uniref:uncharacterized protein n=1 Tax=Polychytrium aggregatum TaxID=110093 RepID=UPI0022FF0899|nr:uncharacterized protein BJ171DRAFT_254666 [Polychytrium aggregatum]KAI9207746.1 hypothetical protein BJ171DRAFT_254666 [Polychytrium aggregatum]